MLRRLRVPGVFGVTLTVVVGGLLAGAPVPVAAAPAPPPAPQQWPRVHGGPAKPVTLPHPHNDAATSWKPRTTTWPAAGTATVNLTPATAHTGTGAGTAAAVVAGSLPVSLTAPTAGTAPSSVSVTLSDRAASQRAGVDGLLVELQTPGVSTASSVVATVDYSSIADVYGGDWASRLRLVRLPACALTTPTVAACQVQTPLATTADRSAETLTAPVTLQPAAAAPRSSVTPLNPMQALAAPAVAVLAAASTPSSNAGDYTATPLKPTGTWTAGGSSGDFTYSYPIETPPVPGKLAPKVSLGYDSQSVDGEQVATNNQSSWIGDGWSYTPGYIERSYIDCADDPAGTAPKTADACWDGQIVHLSFGADSGDLVWDAGAGSWRISGDNGATVQLLTGASNGDNNGEYWKVSTQDGTQYYFGLNRLPGYTSDAATPPTSSAWTQKVYGAHPGDPCNNPAGFASSSCDQAWRWNLDYVVDTHHNAIAYYYHAETNFYGADGSTAGVSYVRGGYLDHIDYGLVDPNPYSGHAPARVAFNTAERCVVSDTACAPGNIATAPSNWPDVPYDLNCASGATCNVHAQTLWSRIRLKGITTQIWGGAAYAPVDTYALTQTFPDPGDGTTPAMWLSSVQRTGNVGTAISLPPVTFAATKLANRVDTLDHAPAMNHNRISTITTETGEVIGVNYTNPGCTAPVTTEPSTNTSLCYPVYWTPQGLTTPTLDWFNKYVISEIDDQDATETPSVTAQTTYTYPDPPAWHFDDNEVVKPGLRTYGQWRGFDRVQVRTGAGTDAKTLTETYFYRGMDGDVLPGGQHRSVSVTLSSAVTVPGAATSVPDSNQLAGSPREEIAYNGDGGPVDHATVTDYWVSNATATRTRSGLPDLTANMVRTVTTRTTTAITASSPTTWRTTQTDTSYDTSTGLPTVVYDHGDVTVPAQATCTTTSYAPANTSSNLINLPAEVETDAQPCGGSGVNGLTPPTTLSRPADVISDTRTFYDDPTFATTWPQPAPTVGDANLVLQASGYTAGAFVYLTKSKVLDDSFGRPTQTTDANGNTSTTSYTQTNGLTTTVVATNPLQQTVATTTYDPNRGAATKNVAVNGLETDDAYDSLGRLTGVWLPGNNDTTKPANDKFAYQISQAQPSAVTSQTLNEDGSSYKTTITIYDALDRPRQTQTDTPAGGRAITDTFYDTRGWAYKTNNAYWDDSSTPSTTLFDSAGLDNTIPNQNLITFDGLGRTVLDVSNSMGVAQWHTQTVYGGDRTTVIPPAGGTPSATVVDARGRTTELDSYTTAPTVSGGRVTGGSFITTSYGYDHRGNQATTTDNAGNTWVSTIDLLGHTTTKTDPDAGTTQLSYDNNGNVLTSTDARGKTISFTYDALNRKTSAHDGPTSTAPLLAQWAYDSTTITNGIGQLASQTSYTGGNAYTTAITGYTKRYQPLGTTITIPTDGLLAGTYTFTNTYTLTTGLPQTTVYPATTGALPKETVTYGHLVTGELSGVAGNGPYIEDTIYTPLDQPSQIKLGIIAGQKATVTDTYDPHTNRLKDTSVDRAIAPRTRRRRQLHL